MPEWSPEFFYKAPDNLEVYSVALLGGQMGHHHDIVGEQYLPQSVAAKRSKPEGKRVFSAALKYDIKLEGGPEMDQEAVMELLNPLMARVEAMSKELADLKAAPAAQEGDTPSGDEEEKEDAGMAAESAKQVAALRSDMAKLSAAQAATARELKIEKTIVKLKSDGSHLTPDQIRKELEGMKTDEGFDATVARLQAMPTPTNQDDGGATDKGGKLNQQEALKSLNAEVAKLQNDNKMTRAAALQAVRSAKPDLYEAANGGK